MKRPIVLLLFTLMFLLSGCTTHSDTPDIDAAYSELSIEDSLTAIQLPTELHNVPITWSANLPGILTEEYMIIQQGIDVEVTLTASLTLDDKIMSKYFNVTIVADPMIAEADIALDEAKLQTRLSVYGTETIQDKPLIDDLVLPTSYEDVTIEWSSDTPTVVSSTGIVTQPDEGSDSVGVILTVTFTYGEYTQTDQYSYIVYPIDTTVVYEGYYVGATNLTGDALKAFLHELIDDHYVIPYDNLWEYMDETDEDPNNPSNVILLYSGVSMSELNHGGNTNQWNREHVWPRSHGDLENFAAYSDLHHIRPTLVQVNSDRGNLDFDLGGTLVPDTDDCYADYNSFEPRDDVKGDIARILFYMAVRYEGDNGEADLEINDLVNNIGPYIGRLSVLLEWHIQDPVDSFEQARNNAIFEIQGNRNPFIDHPEWVQEIWS